MTRNACFCVRADPPPPPPGPLRKRSNFIQHKKSPNAAVFVTMHSFAAPARPGRGLGEDIGTAPSPHPTPHPQVFLFSFT